MDNPCFDISARNHHWAYRNVFQPNHLRELPSKSKAFRGYPPNSQCLAQGIESRYYRALGSAERLIQKAREIEQSWLKGIGVARALQQANPST